MESILYITKDLLFCNTDFIYVMKIVIKFELKRISFLKWISVMNDELYHLCHSFIKYFLLHNYVVNPNKKSC